MDFQKDFIEKILKILRRGGNIQLVGLPGSGKTVLLSRLARREDLTEFKFFYLDLNLLVDKSVGAVMNFISEAIKEDNFKEGKKVVIIFDGFDNLIDKSLEPVYRVLKAMMNRWRYRLCYLFAVDSKLVDFENLEFLGGLGSALCENIMELPMLNKRDAWIFMETNSQQSGINLCEKEKEEILYLSGGLMRTMRRLMDAKAKGIEPSQDMNLKFHLEELAKWMKTEGVDGFDRFPLLKSLMEAEKVGKELTAEENKLWQAMLKRKGSLIDKEELIRELWGERAACEISNHALDQLIHRLRKKMGKTKIKTVFGRGYKIDV